MTPIFNSDEKRDMVEAAVRRVEPPVVAASVNGGICPLCGGTKPKAYTNEGQAIDGKAICDTCVTALRDRLPDGFGRTQLIAAAKDTTRWKLLMIDALVALDRQVLHWPGDDPPAKPNADYEHTQTNIQVEREHDRQVAHAIDEGYELLDALPVEERVRVCMAHLNALRACSAKYGEDKRNGMAAWMERDVERMIDGEDYTPMTPYVLEWWYEHGRHGRHGVGLDRELRRLGQSFPIVAAT